MRKPLVALITLCSLSLMLSLSLVTGAAGPFSKSMQAVAPALPPFDVRSGNMLTTTLYLPAVLRTTLQSVSWAASGHADRSAEAFTHWDDQQPPEIFANCAKCHSTYGFLDFLGEDGTAAGKVDNPAPVGSVIECEACHNPTAESMNSVLFPSQEVILNLGAQAPCMQCHQGRSSSSTLDNLIAAVAVDDDITSGDLNFINPHYYAAGATLYGTEVRGAYEYFGKTYVGKYPHVSEYDNCITCHDAHGLNLVVDECDDCHIGVSSEADLENIRFSSVDFDGDGDQSEGIAKEIDTFFEALLPAMQAYAKNTLGTAIYYDPGRYPYYFIDTNGNGRGDSGEDDPYAPWSPRLLRAAYNYQWIRTEPGAYAHNPPYILQILYDSLSDIGADVIKMSRPQ